MVGATPLARMGPPTPEEAGYVDVCECIEVGGDRVTIVRQYAEGDPEWEAGDRDRKDGGKEKRQTERSRTATILLRGATQNHLDNVERAIDDGVSVLKSLIKDPRLVAGAGATELEIAKRVEAYGGGMRGLSQHSVRRWAAALEVMR